MRVAPNQQRLIRVLPMALVIAPICSRSIHHSVGELHLLCMGACSHHHRLVPSRGLRRLLSLLPLVSLVASLFFLD